MLTALRERAALVDSEHPELTIKDQCELLAISRSAYYFKEGQVKDERVIAILMAIFCSLQGQAVLRVSKNGP